MYFYRQKQIVQMHLHMQYPGRLIYMARILCGSSRNTAKSYIIIITSTPVLTSRPCISSATTAGREEASYDLCESCEDLDANSNYNGFLYNLLALKQSSASIKPYDTEC